ncbi:hypothetical protein KMI_07g11890 [Encephalitozoon hellem]|nr:hypothetical protein KMI_07g11890 [Encephalitozoon hellem]
MKESEVISKIEEVFGIEDPAILPERVRGVIGEILEGGVFPISHPFYADFINLAFDVLYPDTQQAGELLKRSGFTRDQLEKTGLKKLDDMARSIDLRDGKGHSEGEDSKPKRRKKVSWGENLIQIKEIERTVMDPEVDLLISGTRNSRVLEKSPDILEWITPERLDNGCGMAKSPGCLEQERRESISMRVCNTEEHRKFSPTQCMGAGEDNEPITIPVIGFVKNKMPDFDFKKIVEDRFNNMMSINEILEDTSVVNALLGKN